MDGRRTRGGERGCEINLRASPASAGGERRSESSAGGELARAERERARAPSSRESAREMSSGLLRALLLALAAHGVAAFVPAPPPQTIPSYRSYRSSKLKSGHVRPGRAQKATGVYIGIREDSAHGRWLLRHEASRDARTTHWLIALDALLFDSCQLFNWRYHWIDKLEAATLVAMALCIDNSLGPGAGLTFAVAGAYKFTDARYSRIYGESGRRVRCMTTDQMRQEIESLGPHPQPLNSVDGILFTVLRMHVGPEDGMNECFRGLGPKRSEATAPAQCGSPASAARNEHAAHGAYQAARAFLYVCAIIWHSCTNLAFL
jgi:hypothetical protein